MTPRELSVARQRLESFAAEMLVTLPRADQRAKGQSYLRGLLLDGQRKSMQPMAARLGIDHQGLQQFVTASTWDVAAVRERLAQRAVEVIAPRAWVIDDTGFPKDGVDSPCVARQYSGSLGKVANCQIGVSVHAVTDTASCPLGWRLFVPASWDDDAADPDDVARVRARRARCGIGADEHHRSKWVMAVEMLDELARWGLRPPVIAADAGYGDNALFRAALTERQVSYIVQVKGACTAHPVDAVPELIEYSGLGPRPKSRYRSTPVSLTTHVLAAGRDTARTITWREGSKGSLTSQFVILQVRVAGRRPVLDSDGALPPCWLIAEWPDDEPEPIKYWLSNLPGDTDPTELVRYGKIRWRIEHDYRELKTGLGLDHFEGRSWIGWHRHVTLVTAAQLFITTLRLDPKADAPV